MKNILYLIEEWGGNEATMVCIFSLILFAKGSFPSFPRKNCTISSLVWIFHFPEEIVVKPSPVNLALISAEVPPTWRWRSHDNQSQGSSLLVWIPEKKSGPCNLLEPKFSMCIACSGDKDWGSLGCKLLHWFSRFWWVLLGRYPLCGFRVSYTL